MKDKKFSVSTDEESYSGTFDSREAACDDAATLVGVGGSFWVGENVSPPLAEEMWKAEDWLEQVSCQDEYSHDCAADWDSSTKEQRTELEKEVRAVMAAWLGRHNLRPTFFLIERPQHFYVAGEQDGIFEVEAI